MLHWCTISRPCLVPAPNYWSWSKSTFQKIGFCGQIKLQPSPIEIRIADLWSRDQIHSIICVTQYIFIVFLYLAPIRKNSTSQLIKMDKDLILTRSENITHVMYVIFTILARTRNQIDLLCWFVEDQKGDWISYIFGNIFSKLTSSICNTI